jgi:hypothetical protein
MLHISHKSFLKSSSRLGDPWMVRKGWLRGLELELLSAHHADSPHVPGGRSARRLSASSSSCSSCVLVCSSFDPFCPVLLVARSLSDGPRGKCGWSFLRERSAGRARTVRYSRCSTGSSGGFFERSALCLRTVCPAPADSPPPPHGRSASSYGDCLSLCFLSCASVLLWVGVCSSSW